MSNKSNNTRRSGQSASVNKNVLLLKELFPHWTEDDLNDVLNETSGVIESAVARISEGISFFWFYLVLFGFVYLFVFRSRFSVFYRSV